MNRTVIEKNISLEANKLDKNFEKHIYEKIQLLFLNKCHKDYGYIIKIYDNITIIDNIFSLTTSNVIFKVKFGIKSIKPEIGKTFKAKVCMVFSNGIICEIENKIKAVISLNKLTDFIYEDSTFKKDNLIIKKNDTINICIDIVKYDKQNFNCIASMI
jgi:DNA-directed RNA polymerase subunit E'/Rpb7